MASITFQVTGILQTQAFLAAKSIEITKKTDKGVESSGQLLKEEVKASIKGQRPEPRSVDTGEFLRSVRGRKTGKFTAEVSSDVAHAIFLEFGTTHIQERRHFINSLNRMKKKVAANIEQILS